MSGVQLELPDILIDTGEPMGEEEWLDNDDEQIETPQDVIDTLGFDPATDPEFLGAENVSSGTEPDDPDPAIPGLEADESEGAASADI